MARRQIKDEHGSAWDVWDVQPADAAGHPPYDRRTGERTDNESGASLADRPPMLSAELEQGWLCFQCGADRRRFAPIPPNWPELPDGVLRVMLEVANPVSTPATGTRQSPAPNGPQSVSSDPRSSAAE
jgi:rubredoxin